MLRDNIDAAKHRKQLCNIANNLFIGHVCGDQRENVIQKRDHLTNAFLFIFIDQCHQNGSLTLRANCVHIDLADSGVCQRLFTIQVIYTRCQVPSIILIHIIHFFLGQLDADTAQKINYLLESGEVHFCIGIHMDTEVHRQCFIQAAKAAMSIGCIQFLRAISGNIHIGVPQEGNHADGALFGIKRTQDHRVGTLPAFTGAPILTNQQNIDDTVLRRIHIRIPGQGVMGNGFHFRAGKIRIMIIGRYGFPWCQGRIILWIYTTDLI